MSIRWIFEKVFVPGPDGEMAWINPPPVKPKVDKPPTPATVVKGVGEVFALIDRMKNCKSWLASSSCGCGANQCLAGKGRQGIVNHQDCFACIRAQDGLITEAPHLLTGGSGS